MKTYLRYLILRSFNVSFHFLSFLHQGHGPSAFFRCSLVFRHLVFFGSLLRARSLMGLVPGLHDDLWKLVRNAYMSTNLKISSQIPFEVACRYWRDVTFTYTLLLLINDLAHFLYDGRFARTTRMK